MYSVQPDKLKKCKIQIKKDSQDGHPFFMLFLAKFFSPYSVISPDKSSLFYRRLQLLQYKHQQQKIDHFR